MSWTRSRARSPKFAMLDSARIIKPVLATAKATYGCRRMLLRAASIDLMRISERRNRNVASAPAASAWALCASEIRGRNRTVATALGIRVGDSRIDGTNWDPPWDVRALVWNRAVVR